MKQKDKPEEFMKELHNKAVFDKIENIIINVGEAIQFDLKGEKPNFEDITFLNAIFIFENALIDKMFDLQKIENISFEDAEKMASSAGNAIKKIVKTYANIDTEILFKECYIDK